MKILYIRDMPQMQGHCMAYPKKALNLVNVLSHLPSELSIVVFRSPFNRKKLLRGRREKIRIALEFLIANNPYYSHITISNSRLESYPNDDQVIVQEVIESDDGAPIHSQS